MFHRAVVKRVFVELREWAPYLKRLAFYAITEEEAAQIEWVHSTGSKSEDIDIVMTVDEVDLEAMRGALDCYVTYAAMIEAPQGPSRWGGGDQAPYWEPTRHAIDREPAPWD